MWYVSMMNTVVTSPIIRWFGGPLRREKLNSSSGKRPQNASLEILLSLCDSALMLTVLKEEDVGFSLP